MVTLTQQSCHRTRRFRSGWTSKVSRMTHMHRMYIFFYITYFYFIFLFIISLGLYIFLFMVGATVMKPNFSWWRIKCVWFWYIWCTCFVRLLTLLSIVFLFNSVTFPLILHISVIVVEIVVFPYPLWPRPVHGVNVGLYSTLHFSIRKKQTQNGGWGHSCPAFMPAAAEVVTEPNQCLCMRECWEQEARHRHCRCKSGIKRRRLSRNIAGSLYKRSLWLKQQRELL